MRLERIVSRGRIVDLRSLDLEGALQELLEVCVGKFPDLKPEALLRGLLARESTMTTYLGFGVALPHVRVRMGRRYVLAIGRSRVGIRHDGALADERVHLIVMLIAGENARDYLQVLASNDQLQQFGVSDIGDESSGLVIPGSLLNRLNPLRGLDADGHRLGVAGERHGQSDRNHDRKHERPEHRLGLAKELAQPCERELDDGVTCTPSIHGVTHRADACRSAS